MSFSDKTAVTGTAGSEWCVLVSFIFPSNYKPMTYHYSEHKESEVKGHFKGYKVIQGHTVQHG